MTEAPWTLRYDDLVRARAAGLDDDSILHTILLASQFNYLNRMADAVGIELDYEVVNQPPAAVFDTPPLARPEPADWPDPDAQPPLALTRRPGITETLERWRAHVMERSAPLAVLQRQLIAAVTARCLGDAATVRALSHIAPHIAPQTALDRALVVYAETMTLAPWRLGARALDGLRAAGLTDEPALFDAIAVAAFASMTSRIAVALAALAR